MAQMFSTCIDSTLIIVNATTMSKTYPMKLLRFYHFRNSGEEMEMKWKLGLQHDHNG